MHEIRRTVANSVRSHYGRTDLESLFILQPRAAGKLLQTLPTVAVGTSRLVERQALADFLARVQEADDVAEVIGQVRQEKTVTSRKRLRTLVQRDDSPASLASLPEALSLRRGQIEVNFRTLQELAESMYYLARLLNGDPDSFARQYEPEKTEDAMDAGIPLSHEVPGREATY